MLKMRLNIWGMFMWCKVALVRKQMTWCDCKKDTKRKVKIILKQLFCAFCNNRRGA